MKGFFATILTFLPVLIYAGGHRPPTPAVGPPPPPGLPIDQYLPILLVIGLLLILLFPKVIKLKK